VLLIAVVTMLEATGVATAIAIAGVALPLAVAATLDSLGEQVWEGLLLYKRLDEYGEPKRWSRPVRTLLNSYTSLAFWTAGVCVVLDGATREPTLSNCAAAAPLFNILLGVACMWTGVASFAFHASLTEVWRILDAGATMGVPFLPASLAFYRLALSVVPGLPSTPFALAGLAANVGCHFLARTPGWSDIVLPACILAHIAIDYVLLARFRTREDVTSLAVFVSCALSGIALRVADIKLHRSVPLIWLGHSCWHLLMAFAIWTAYSSSLRHAEPFCA